MLYKARLFRIPLCSERIPWINKVFNSISIQYTTEVVRRILAAKDQGLVSDRAYHELRMALPEDIRDKIPPLSALIQERREQNKTINTIPIPQVRDCLLVISY